MASESHALSGHAGSARTPAGVEPSGSHLGSRGVFRSDPETPVEVVVTQRSPTTGDEDGDEDDALDATDNDGTDSDGIDTPTPTDNDGTDSDGIDTPTPTDNDGIDTPLVSVDTDADSDDDSDSD